jgi:SAM-dependent methyltransferase
MRIAKKKEISVEDILEKIREEVAKKDTTRADPDSQTSSSSDVSIIQSCKINDRGNNMSSSNQTVYYTEKMKNKLLLSDLNSLHDEEFINNAYKTILQRNADQDGLSYYLNNLRIGKFSKTDILAKLRFSKEGRSTGIDVSGLFVRFLIRLFFRIPILGYFLKLADSIIRLPILLRATTRLEAQMNFRIKETLELLSDYSDTLKIEIRDSNQRSMAEVEQQLLDKYIETIETRLTELKEESGKVQIDLSDQKMLVLDQQRRLFILLEEIRKKHIETSSSPAIDTILAEEDSMLDAMYVSFEDRYRGTRTEIKKRLETYLPIIEEIEFDSENDLILDLGCGRGEWLEILKENKKKAVGIEINPIMIRECRERGLDIDEADALAYLRNLQRDNVIAITGFHLVEHLPLKTLINLIDESVRVLKPGGCLIFETPNPENVLVSSQFFYLDPTHSTPINRHTLKFILEYRGFSKISDTLLNPFPERFLLNGQEVDKRFNEYFYGAQDYAVIAYKS